MFETLKSIARIPEHITPKGPFFSWSERQWQEGCLGRKSRVVITGEATRPLLRFPTLRSKGFITAFLCSTPEYLKNADRRQVAGSTLSTVPLLRSLIHNSAPSVCPLAIRK